ncbi:MAG: DEAD/DEAH box helicase [Alphaproteobacteria bacterium]
MNSFNDLGLAAPILTALAEEGYATPTPIQAQAIPHVLAGRDLQGIAQTGTGKTAAFALPILNRLAADRRPAARNACRVLVLSPTRELSGQILESFNSYGRHLKLRATLAIGGVPLHRQARAVAAGVDILVATPGRLLDLVDNHRFRLNEVEVLVLDEADRMLDMGFIHAIRRICTKLPKTRQSLFFSATMPRAIAELAGELLTTPQKVAVAPVSSTAEAVSQQVIFLDRAAKPRALFELLSDRAVERALVFTRTKHGADRVVRGLHKDGLEADAIHGNKSQSQRERALDAFRRGRVRVLVATDIAARGIDVDGVSHVVNFDLPNVAETYVHRIGRTARAGASGTAVSFCSDADERGYLRAIETLIRQRIPTVERRGGAGQGDAAWSAAPAPKPARQPSAAPGSKRRNARHRPAAQPTSHPRAGTGEMVGLGFMRPVPSRAG